MVVVCFPDDERTGQIWGPRVFYILNGITATIQLRYFPSVVDLRRRPDYYLLATFFSALMFIQEPLLSELPTVRKVTRCDLSLWLLENWSREQGAPKRKKTKNRELASGSVASEDIERMEHSSRTKRKCLVRLEHNSRCRRNTATSKSSVTSYYSTSPSPYAPYMTPDIQEARSLPSSEVRTTLQATLGDTGSEPHLKDERNVTEYNGGSQEDILYIKSKVQPEMTENNGSESKDVRNNVSGQEVLHPVEVPSSLALSESQN
ncbi:hypothetical protein CBL_00524 [Carabus blaptoides fortunei]